MSSDDPITGAFVAFVASFTVLPVFFLALWVVGIPFGSLRINLNANGLVLTSAGFATVIGLINTMQGSRSGVGWLIGAIAAIFAWRGARDRLPWGPWR